jgi:outer membrane murein-binding lipoprotein Lpp
MTGTSGADACVHQEELDRREVLVQQLQAQNDDLTSTVEMLKEELISTSAEAERASGELDNMRSRAFEESAQENLVRERELRETQTELERCRMEKDEWERMALQDKVVADEARSNAEMYRRDLELEREARERDAAELESEREKSDNLQSVLQDFQAGASVNSHLY